MKGAGRAADRSWRRFLQSKDATTALEFGLIAMPLLILLLGSFEVSLDLYAKAVLDTSLVQATRQVQTGNAQNVINGTSFVNNYLCPNMGLVLNCNNVFVQIRRLTPTSAQDYYNFTTGRAPVSGGALNLTSYGSANFCNSGPAQFLLISAVYLGPSIIGQLIPGAFAVPYNGGLFDVTFSSVGTVTESYAAAALAGGAAPAC